MWESLFASLLYVISYKIGGNALAILELQCGLDILPNSNFVQDDTL